MNCLGCSLKSLYSMTVTDSYNLEIRLFAIVERTVKILSHYLDHCHNHDQQVHSLGGACYTHGGVTVECLKSRVQTHTTRLDIILPFLFRSWMRVGTGESLSTSPDKGWDLLVADDVFEGVHAVREDDEADAEVLVSDKKIPFNPRCHYSSYCSHCCLMPAPCYHYWSDCCHS